MNILGQLPFFGFPPPFPPLNFPSFPIFNPGPQIQLPLVQQAPAMPFILPQIPQIPGGQGFYQVQPQAFQQPAPAAPITLSLALYLCRCLPGQGGQGQRNGRPIAPQPRNNQPRNNRHRNNRHQNNQAQNNPVQNNPAQQNPANVAPQANPQPAPNVQNVNGGPPIQVNI